MTNVIELRESSDCLQHSGSGRFLGALGHNRGRSELRKLGEQREVVAGELPSLHVDSLDHAPFTLVCQAVWVDDLGLVVAYA